MNIFILLPDNTPFRTETLTTPLIILYRIAYQGIIDFEQKQGLLINAKLRKQLNYWQLLPQTCYLAFVV